MKEKLLVALKTKYKTFGFGDKAFDGVADYLSKTVTEESAIETAISGVEGLLKAFQGDIDTVRNEKSGLQKQLDELKAKGTENKDDPTKQDPPKDVPEWQKAIEGLTATVQTLASTVGAQQAEKTHATLSQKLTSILSEKKVPEWYSSDILDGRTFKDEAEVDTWAEKIGTKWGERNQELANNGFKETVPPSSGSENVKESEVIAGMINTGTKEIVEQQKQN